MIRITADTSTLYSPTQAKEAGFEVAALTVNIAGRTYKELEEIEGEAFIEIINQGNMPISSQPAIGDVLDIYNSDINSDVIHITLADGLSGSYQTAQAAKKMAENPNRITVINSRTLCGPHRYLVENALAMVKKGLTTQAIIRHTEELMKQTKSFLVPQDFAYLRRGGRLSPLVSYVGQAIRFCPVLTPTEDGKQLTIAGVKRNFAGALETMAKSFEALHVGENHRIYISHAQNLKNAQQALELMKNRFPKTKIDLVKLSPAFITQGGPGCVAVQCIHL